jgi:hypothetical protein
VLQVCYKGVTRVLQSVANLSQVCYKHVTTHRVLFSFSMRCASSSVTNMLPKLYKGFTGVSSLQGAVLVFDAVCLVNHHVLVFELLEKGLRVLQGCYECVTRVLRGYYKGVTRNGMGCESRKGCIGGVS